MGPVRLTVAAVLAAATLGPAVAAGAPPDAPGCDLSPDGWYLSADVRGLPVDPDSAAFVAAIGSDRPVHPDFGAGEWDGGPIGIPYVAVPGDQRRVPISFHYDDESDPGPYPLPPDAPIEGGPDANGDRHVLVLDRVACTLWEVYDAHPEDGGWSAGSGAVFDLADPRLRPDGWTSADAAGLPILPLLVRYDEVAAGHIDHPIRVTVPRSQNQHVWPARHHAGRAEPGLPPMGLWLRLRADVDLAALAPQARVVAAAMQRHGVIVADNGSPWYLSGVPDERWDNDDLRTLRTLTGADFEVVDTRGLAADPDLALVGDRAERWAGDDRVATALAVSRAAFPDGAPAAVLARADDFADALAAGPLAAALGGPVLLTPSTTLDARIAAELDRLGASEVVVAGGEAAVGPAVTEAASASGRAVIRRAGRDRFATAAALARETVDRRVGSTDDVVVALGSHPDRTRAWPDALAAGPLAATLGAPLVLVTPTTVPAVTREVVRALAPSRITVVGGTAAVSQHVTDDLARIAPAARVAGADRYATAAAVAARVGGDLVLVASGQSFPDALAAGPAAAAHGGRLVLTARDHVPPVVVDHLRRWPGQRVVVVGGPAAVSPTAAVSLVRP